MCFHSDHWRAVEAHVLDAAGGSDHRPVVVTLAVGQRRRRLNPITEVLRCQHFVRSRPR